MTATQDITLGVISGIITAILGTLAAKGWGSLSYYDRRRQRDFLAKTQDEYFVQRTQRDLFRYIGLAIYAIGGYIAFEFEFRYSLKVAVAFKFAIGVSILFCGGLIMGNASVMNEYGIKKRREAIEKLERKRRERKELEND